MNCIFKTAMNKNNDIQWQALYVNGIKVLESFEIDIDKALPIFAPNHKCENINVYEYDFENIDDAFPIEEDFTYLLDYRDIKVGNNVWLLDGEWIISEIIEGYREQGEYEYTEWINLKPHKRKVYYDGHVITKFKVRGKNITFVWEDYNYQQSFLYEHFHKYNIV